MLHLRHGFRTQPHFVAYQGRRPAGPRPLDRPQRVRLCPARLDRAHAGAADAGRAICGSDDLRGFRAVGALMAVRAPLKSLLQCTIFGRDWSPCAMADRNAWTGSIRRWHHPKSPSKPYRPSAKFRLRIGTPAPIPSNRPANGAWHGGLHPGSQAIPSASSKPAYNPFVSHAFLSALEAIGFGLRPDRLGTAASAWPGSTARSPASCPAI